MASQNDAKKLRRLVQQLDKSTQFLASILQSHVWLRKALLSPKGKLWNLALLLGASPQSRGLKAV